MPEQIALTGQLEVQKLDAEHFVLTAIGGSSVVVEARPMARRVLSYSLTSLC